MSSHTRPGARRGLAALVGVVSALALVACQRGPATSSADDTGAVDDATTITMWTRSPTATFSQTLVDAYNASHRNKVELTVFPADSYQQKVGTAAGARQLPDVLAADVVYAPNYAAKGVYLDITARVNQLPFRQSLAPAHMKAATHDGKNYAVPHDIDLSAVFYNKVLFARAGLDPDKPPSTLDELVADARRVQALGGGVSGYFFGGACPGCQLFTTWPMIWASGGTVLNEQGTAATMDNPAAARVYAMQRQLYAEGVVPASAKNESGPTWTQLFSEGKVGIQPMGATALQGMREGPDLRIGVAPIPGLTGGGSSFVGGDVLGISANSQHAAAAWDFISWTLSDQAQVDVVARSKNITVRSDLADNPHATQDPRLGVFNRLVGQGQTPISVNFGRTFNDTNGPWTAAVIDAVFGTGEVSSVLHQHNPAITESLASGG
ncbi:ABC transporter substrate-binding protein [Goodfellowiella coeruleoviolacea]|uniref:Multiple sugar transport system substrate-binding protein n=1 Tax=Goodfellowiella coeruleoviolacea TaxID=334858 RepID=A0AAE3GFM9_9PSEU|nr:sugar ABC transporter substrate-binding protein [Goodfellowiella coeruleoviolacea]MCP2167326.1 multiple sugar transport system substrate-binding protein [Goodfellowiella coeruleoviolacea]